jgi:hypothetical protein
MDFYFDDDAAAGGLEGMAWRDFDNRTGRPARWSKLHSTQDRGATVLCGATVPAESYDSDNYGNGDRCKRCVAVSKAKGLA